MVKTAKNPEKPANLASKLDRDLAAAAYRKVMQGGEPTARERAALRRFEKDQEEARRWQYYASIPKKHWREMSGRQVKVINQQAALYGLPLEGATIDLPKLAKALHDFLAKNAIKLSREDDALLGGDSGSPALEDYRRERAKLAKLERQEREGELLPTHLAREGLGRIASLLRSAGETLGRQFGPAASGILDEALDNAQREIDRTFGNGQHPIAGTGTNNGA